MMGRGAARHGGTSPLGAGCHAAAFRCATPAGIGTLPAMFQRVPFAFLGAQVAQPGTGFADDIDGGAVPGHGTGGEATEGGTVDVEADAAGQRLGIRLCQAGRGAMIAGIGTSIAGVDAGTELFVSHDFLRQEIQGMGMRLAAPQAISKKPSPGLIAPTVAQGATLR